MANNLKAVAVIPSRYGSTRFPGKALADIAGKTLIERVYTQVSLAKSLSDVLVATDDKRIFDEVTRFGGKAVMTSDKHKSGTDRIAEALENIECDIVVNVQGDEPLIPPDLIDNLVALFDDDPELKVTSAAHLIDDWDTIYSPDAVKVILNDKSEAIYFSRSVIPNYANLENLNKLVAEGLPFVSKNSPKGWQGYLKHIGIYVFRKEILLKYASMKPTPLELIEKLEQLRLIENGIPIKIILTDYRPVAVDTPEDIPLVIKVLQNR
ncbi:MAG: 3-deoxy-manno-octulosonate cytidylyltransferase [candidate division Zixibacteria bacterium]|nr:3-deoxy-manno-octulosonate cytidylyltransferase [candidate division Zixibacteria bacterium]